MLPISGGLLVLRCQEHDVGRAIWVFLRKMISTKLIGMWNCVHCFSVTLIEMSRVEVSEQKIRASSEPWSVLMLRVLLFYEFFIRYFGMPWWSVKWRVCVWNGQSSRSEWIREQTAEELLHPCNPGRAWGFFVNYESAMNRFVSLRSSKILMSWHLGEVLFFKLSFRRTVRGALGKLASSRQQVTNPGFHSQVLVCSKSG